ncbi:MAG: zf-HC2 domain-containing protein [Clostridia bacterium]
MKEKRDCKIVQDMLPNYIERLTTVETNQYIEEHLKDCENCQKVLDNMKKEILLDNKKRDKREINYIKKFNKKMRILEILLLGIFLLYLLVVGRRTWIMVSLSEKAKVNLRNDNYTARLYSYQGESLTITQTYHYGEDYLTTMNWYSVKNGNRKITFYKKGNEKISLAEQDGKKYLLDAEKMVGGQLMPVTYVSEGFWANLQYALFIGIDSTYCNGRECYVIKGNSYERYVDKITGLAVRNIEKSNKGVIRQTDMVIDYTYEYDVVKEGDIIRPDTENAVVSE